MATLRIEDLQTQLRAGEIRHVYILAGEEAYLQEEAWRSIEKKVGADALNTEVFYLPEASLNDVLLAAQTPPFLSDRRLIAVKDAHEMKAADAEKLAQFIHHPAPYCLVLFWSEKVRKDGKKNGLFSVAEKVGAVVDLRPLYDRELPLWIQKKVRGSGKTIQNDAVQALIQESGSGLLDLSNELEKLDLYTGARKEITVRDVETLSGHTRAANLNNLAEALEAGKTGECLTLVEELLEEGEVPLKMMAVVYRVVRRLLAARSLLEQKKSSHQDIRQELHLNPYFDRNFLSNIGLYSVRGLERDLELLVQADLELKTSARPESMIFEELLLSLSGNRRNKPG